MMSVLGIFPNSRLGWSPIICPVIGIPGVRSFMFPIMTFCPLAESDFPELKLTFLGLPQMIWLIDISHPYTGLRYSFSQSMFFPHPYTSGIT
jgi:hypothetical protein